MAGIVGYGAHLPRHRIKVEEIAKVWGADAPSYKKGLMLREKSVPPPDMDTITLSVEAAKNAFRRAGDINRDEISLLTTKFSEQPFLGLPRVDVCVAAKLQHAARCRPRFRSCGQSYETIDPRGRHCAWMGQSQLP